MSKVQSGLQYSAEHEWINDESPRCIGVSEVATDALGEIVYVDLPEIGTTISAGSEIGEIESTKSVSALHSPVSGDVVDVNEAVVDDPTLVNSDPYGAGWLIKVAVSEEGVLLSPEQYAADNGAEL